MTASPHVRVWQVDLGSGANWLPPDAEILSEDECLRAARFRFSSHRERYVRCRTALRILLGGVLGQRPVSINFRYGVAGKPFLANGGCDVQFNVSHSGRDALIAICSGAAVGIDVEQRRVVPDAMAIADSVFSHAEQRALLSSRNRGRAFLNGWTRKEAVLKAIGLGLSAATRSFTVSLDAPPRMLSADAFGYSQLTIFDLSRPKTIAALAVVAGKATVSVQRLERKNCEQLGRGGTRFPRPIELESGMICGREPLPSERERLERLPDD